jgi:hypothetical protein
VLESEWDAGEERIQTGHLEHDWRVHVLEAVDPNAGGHQGVEESLPTQEVNNDGHLRGMSAQQIRLYCHIVAQTLYMI